MREDQEKTEFVSKKKVEKQSVFRLSDFLVVPKKKQRKRNMLWKDKGNDIFCGKMSEQK